MKQENIGGWKKNESSRNHKHFLFFEVHKQMGKWDSSDEEGDKDVLSRKRQKLTKKNAQEEKVVEKLQKAIEANQVHQQDNDITSSGSESINLQIQTNIVTTDYTDIAVHHQEPIVTKIVKPSHNPSIHGCRSVECYQRLNYIDEGTYGMVFRAKDIETNEIYALKQVKLTPETTRGVGFPITALREINILMALRHPNIVKVKEMVVGSSIDKIYMVMEYCENDLKVCMQSSKQSFSIAEIKRLMFQLLSAIDHMHSLWYIHRDLKSSNLLYSNKGVLSVCDFGLARRFGEPIAPYTAEVVTLWYRCPELLLGSKTYSTPLDMWSVGCIFAEMLTGEPLFPGQGEIDQMSKIFSLLGVPNESVWPGFADLPDCNKIGRRLPSKNTNFIEKFKPKPTALSLTPSGFDLLSKMLLLDPKQRVSAKDALEHPWLKTELPYPTLEENMPKFKSKHE